MFTCVYYYFYVCFMCENKEDTRMWAYDQRDGRPRNTGGALC